MQEPQTCPNCGRQGMKAGMATHVKYCDPFLDVEAFNAKVQRAGDDEGRHALPTSGTKLHGSYRATARGTTAQDVT